MNLAPHGRLKSSRRSHEAKARSTSGRAASAPSVRDDGQAELSLAQADVARRKGGALRLRDRRRGKEWTVINAHHAEPMAAIWGAGATWDHDGEAPVGQGAFRAGRGRSKR